MQRKTSNFSLKSQCAHGKNAVRKKVSRSARVSLDSGKLSSKALANAIISPAKEYPWLVLDSLRKDLSEYLTENINDELSVIIRKRDLKAYKIFSEEHDLQSTSCADTIPEIRAKYLLGSILKKYQFQTSEAERKIAAKKKFLSAEALCKKVNLNGKLFEDLSDDDMAAFSYARQYIVNVIGASLPDMTVLNDKARHGPGATLCTKRGQTSSFFKYSEFPYSCTESAKSMAISMIKSDERWSDLLYTYHSRNTGEDMCNSKKNAADNISYGILVKDDHNIVTEEVFWSQFIKIVPGNRISFVPKNAFTERTIAIEPTLNLMLQLGIDGHIRSRLKRFGVDLDHQEKNQELARLGSIDNNFCTIDLAAASDTISLYICKLLLPPVWFDLLMKLRSPVGELGDDVISYEKMSSMGNGFTFALESLIFASLTYAAAKMNLGPRPLDCSKFAVYGDDLIVENSHAANLVPLLYKSGFRLNKEKSFFNGDCRESCGMDWFKGYNVRPVHLTGLPVDIRELWCDINRLQRILSLRFGIPLYSSHVFRLLNKWIPSNYSDVIGPQSNEDFDTYLHSELPKGDGCSRFSSKKAGYEYLRIVKIPSVIKAFGASRFRKLMHNLRPYITSKYSWLGDRSGKRFEVVSRNAMTLTKIIASTDNWYLPYSEVTPVWIPDENVLL